MTASASLETEAADRPAWPPVFVVDDDAAVRDGLVALLSAGEIPVEAFGDWPSFLARRRSADGPAILVLDIRLGRGNGLDLYTALAREGLACPVIFMTAYADVPTAVEALRLSATDFLEKPFGREQLFAALDRARQSLATEPAPGEAGGSGEIAERYETLSPREAEVFAAMAAGQSTKETARRLGISPRTVEVHRSRVMQKMKTDSLASLVRLAVALRVPLPESGP